MAQNISQELMRIPKKMPAVRIHDDCLASGDSIISYLYDRVQDAGELDKLQKNGVNIVIDGAATAQGILYLQMFANSFHIPLELTAGHMAFGLTAGVRENPEAPLRHANYITYPPQSDKEFYKKLGKIERHQIEGFGDAGAVAGDMGEAERGIDNATMQAIRQWVGDENYCKWNDERTDDHGGHKLSKKGISIQTKSGEGVTDHVYFARGGFLPYMFDLMTILSKQSPVAEKANVIITRLSRLNVTDGEYGKLGYGAGFTEASCVKYVS
ncbi:MAG: hypothetical protein NTV98_03560 [Candidatus Roizmanbacteria bacterium]|nr:hypothetical protein [Candidatus Roizmanbacteria bacterium]